MFAAGVEDIPIPALEAGMPFKWETMPEFLDHLQTIECACDFAALCAHGAIRAYVMGERGADHSAPVSAHDVESMQLVAKQAIEAGALGLGINRQPEHRDLGGNPVPGTFSPDAELEALGDAVQQAGGGIMEVVTDSEFFTEPEYAAPERALYERLASATTPVIFNCHPFGTDQDAELYGWLEAAAERGNDIRGVCSTKAINLLIGTDSNSNPFLASATYRTLGRLPLAERIVQLAREEIKAVVLQEVSEAGFYSVFQSKFAMGSLAGVYPMLDAPGEPHDWHCFEPQPDHSVQTLAEQNGQASMDWMYDFMLELDGRSALIYPIMNYTEGNLDGCREMLLHPCTVPGLADTGAHVGSMQDAMNATYLLSYWVRDRERLTGRPGIPLETAVKLHTWDAAEVCGMLDRGMIRPGMKADVNVIDLEKLTIHPPRVVNDLPTDAKRWVQDVSGYDLIVIAGQVTYEHNQPTGALPGRLVRNPRTQHVRDAGEVQQLDLDEVLAGRSAAHRPLIGRGSLDQDGWAGEGPPSTAVLDAREAIVVEMKQLMLARRAGNDGGQQSKL
eukprot:COSAG02_NODE_36_length_48934_cov_144.851029_19_plen_560_part_00